MHAHDLLALDARHAGLLSVIVAGWFLSAWIGACAERRDLTTAALILACFPAVVLLASDPWLSLAALQGPLFVWLGSRVTRWRIQHDL